jgi:hypothetical protein
VWFGQVGDLGDEHVHQVAVREGERHVGAQQGIERLAVVVGAGEGAGGAVEQLLGASGDDGVVAALGEQPGGGGEQLVAPVERSGCRLRRDRGGVGVEVGVDDAVDDAGEQSGVLGAGQLDALEGDADRRVEAGPGQPGAQR